VYEGNVPGDGGENTYCYRCGELLIPRCGFQILENKIRDPRCPSCGARRGYYKFTRTLEPALTKENNFLVIQKQKVLIWGFVTY